MVYNLKITNKQGWLIQNHIYDLCNYRLGDTLEETKNSSKNFTGWDEYDVLRANIYFKEFRLNKAYSIFRGLTKEELNFISSEITYWVFSGFEREPKERQMAKRIIDNINKVNDTQYQRNLILEEILK